MAIRFRWNHGGLCWPGLAMAMAALFALGCERRAADAALPGYLEGDWVYVAAPVAGKLQELTVAKGAMVTAGAPLFQLDPEPEAKAWQEAVARRSAAAARLDNTRKGLRPSEVAALQARLASARAAVGLSEIELRRAEKLSAQGVVPQADVDNARSRHDRDLALIAQTEAELVTAGLGSRQDEIRAAEAELAAAAAQLAQAAWRRDQKRQVAPAAGLVQDTLFRVGEWVAAGAPVIMLLPPENVKVRVFVPEALAATLKPGQAVTVLADGLPERRARLTFISNQVEYTPPVLFSRDQRAKLVYLVEAVFEAAPGAAAAPSPWKPGLPVEVRFLP